MNKFWLGVQGYVSCFGWIVVAIWETFLECSPDLFFWRPRTSFGDYIRYAERVNGRLAMLAVTYLTVQYVLVG